MSPLQATQDPSGPRRSAATGSAGASTRLLPCGDYDLDGTFQSGQLFRWERVDRAWEGLVGRRWVRLNMEGRGIRAESMGEGDDWRWLEDFLRVEDDLGEILRSFPDDEPMRRAIEACRGLRLVRQDPWECLASFILSSTKQIVQIRQVVEGLCGRYGDEVPAPAGRRVWRSFPGPERIAALEEGALRECRMGFRAPFLLEAARAVEAGRLDLEGLSGLEEEAARERLMSLRGVGRKIADCVLLFACGFPRAFPVDVWVTRALRDLYFGGGRPTGRELMEFSRSYFGRHGGYAQQYLFHYIRVHARGRGAEKPADRSGTIA